MNERTALLKARGQIQEFEIPRGYTSVSPLMLGDCGFHPRLTPGARIEHICPTGPDVDELEALEAQMSRLTLWNVGQWTPETARQRDELADRIHALREAIAPRVNVQMGDVGSISSGGEN